MLGVLFVVHAVGTGMNIMIDWSNVKPGEQGPKLIIPMPTANPLSSHSEEISCPIDYPMIVPESDPNSTDLDLPVAQFGNVAYKRLHQMSDKQLRKCLSVRGVACKHCLDRQALISRVSNTIHLPLLKTLGTPTSFTALGWGGLSVFPTQTRILNISRTNHDYMSHLRALEGVMTRSGPDAVFGLLWGQPGHVGTLIKWKPPERLDNGDLRLKLEGIGRFVVTKLSKTGLRAMFDIQARQFDDTDDVSKAVALEVMSELFATKEAKPTPEEQSSVTSTARSVSMLLAASVGCSLGDKQFMLEMTSTMERLRLVHQIVSKKKAELGPEVLSDI